MRIAFVVDHDIEITNGVSLQTKQFLTWLTDNNHEIHLIFPSTEKKAGHTNGRNISYHPVPAFSIPSYREYSVPLPPLAVSLWLKNWKIDLIHAETINPTLLLLAHWIKQRAKVPMFNVITANIPYYSHILFTKNNFIKKASFKIGRAMMNRISNRIQGTFILSEGVRRSLTQEFYSIDQKKVFMLKRPIDLRRFGGKSSGFSVFDRFHVPRGKRLVTLSRLCQTKNVGFLITAFAKYIYPMNPDLHFFIGGYGPLDSQLKAFASRLGCPTIHFLGKIDLDSVPGFLKEADYFLYASLSETFGNVICEAKFSGVPVIALEDRAGVSSQIENYRTGILVRNHEEKVFAEKFFELRNNPALREKMRRNAHWNVLHNHDPQTIYSNLIHVYEKFVKNDPCAGEELIKLFSQDRLSVYESESSPYVVNFSQRERMYD